MGVGEEGILSILKNSATAPRGLWLALHKKLTELVAKAVLGERCLWIWLSKTLMDGAHPKVIGAMSVTSMTSTASVTRMTPNGKLFEMPSTRPIAGEQC